MKLKINHFNINVTDLDKSIKFYQDNLKLQILRELNDTNGEYKIVYLSDSKKDVTIELTWIKSKIGKYNLGDNEFHIALTTDDYQSTYNMHKENNVIVYENKNMGVYFIRDPDGYWIEIFPENYYNKL